MDICCVKLSHPNQGIDIVMYSVKAVTRITGISADTLRAWERRHHAITPARDGNGRRSYSNLDVSRLQLLKKATELGHSIGRVAGLSDGEIRALWEAADHESSTNRSVLGKRLIDAIERYDVNEVDEVLGVASTGLSSLSLATEILGPALVEVGNLWHQKKINSAQEHLFSNCIKRLVFSFINLYQKQAGTCSLVFSTLAPERHELGLLMSCLLASGQGFKCYYLGPDLPRKDLAEAVGTIQPAALVLGFVEAASEDSDLVWLRKNIPDECELWLGGPGASSVSLRQLSGEYTFLESLDHFMDALTLLRGGRI